MRITRNRFLTLSGTAALSLFSRDPAAAEETPVPIVDPHFHVWDLKQFKLRWLDNAGPLLKRNYSIDDYRNAIAGLNVAQSVYVEVDVASEQKEPEARFAIDLCKDARNRTAAVVVGGTPGSDGFERYIRTLSQSRAVHGVRAQLEPKRGADPGFLGDIVLLGQLGLSFDFLVETVRLADAAKLAASAPETRFILDHCGNASTTWFAKGASSEVADRWRRGIELISKQPNVACKISGVAENGASEDATIGRVAAPVNHCLDSFGSERVMFASNWPVCLKSITIAKWVEMLRQITANRGEAYQTRLFHDNAAKWYRLG